MLESVMKFPANVYQLCTLSFTGTEAFWLNKQVVTDMNVLILYLDVS